MSEETRIMTGTVRLSYANIFEARSVNGGDPKYSASLIIPKSDKTTIKKINDAVDKAIELGAAKLDPKNGKPKKSMLKLPLRDGDTERDDEAYQDAYFVNANNAKQPTVVTRNRQPITDADEVYSGCFVRAIIEFYAYNTSGNKGIACALMGVQKVKDGKPLSGSVIKLDDFEDLGEEETEDDNEDFLA